VAVRLWVVGIKKVWVKPLCLHTSETVRIERFQDTNLCHHFMQAAKKKGM
jgi:hypothetical protein